MEATSFQVQLQYFIPKPMDLASQINGQVLEGKKCWKSQHHLWGGITYQFGICKSKKRTTMKNLKIILVTIFFMSFLICDEDIPQNVAFEAYTFGQ